MKKGGGGTGFPPSPNAIRRPQVHCGAAVGSGLPVLQAAPQNMQAIEHGIVLFSSLIYAKKERKQKASAVFCCGKRYVKSSSSTRRCAGFLAL